MKKENGAAIRRSACAISLSLDVVGDKWSLLILRDLMLTQKRSYGELQSSDEGIATNILAARLTNLEANGLIYKVADPDNGRRSHYYLTEKGIGLLPVILELMHWMAQYNAGAEACGNVLKQFKKDRTALIKERTKRLKEMHLKKGQKK